MTSPVCTLSHERDLIRFCESRVLWEISGFVNLIFKHNTKISQNNGEILMMLYVTSLDWLYEVHAGVLNCVVKEKTTEKCRSSRINCIVSCSICKNS